MLITPESIIKEKVDSGEQDSAPRIRTNRSGDQCWNLNCAPPRQTSPEPEPSMMNVGSVPSKKRQQLGKTRVGPGGGGLRGEEEGEDKEDEDEEDEELSSDSCSRHEQQLQFYYWDAIRWAEFPMKTNALLGAALKRNSETVVLPVADNRLYKIDFKNKLQLNLKTGYVRSIAWEGSSTGSREFAGFDKPFERQELLPSDDCLVMMPGTQRKHQQHELIATSSPSPLPPHPQMNVRVDTAAAVAAMLPLASCPFRSKAVETFGKLGQRVAVLEPGNKEFNAVNDVFNKGFSCRPPPHAKRPRLTAVHKVINTEAKLRYFGEQLQSMERSRGNANLRHAWHGSSADAIVSIVMYGFGQRPMSLNGNNFGCGTYLAPCSKLEVSAQYAEVDDNMEQHVLLCEVVLGESERIDPGSCHRFLPSSTSYDSGVDALDNPNIYIIWTPFINSHIIPWYIVSFVTEATQKFSGPLRRSPEAIRPSPYVSSPRQPPVLGLKHVHELFHPSGLQTFSKSGKLQLPARASTTALPALSAMASPRRENYHNNVVHEGSEFVRVLNASKERLQEAAVRSIQVEKTVDYHHNNNTRSLDGLMPDNDNSSISSRIDLNLGLNIDGFSFQSRHPKHLAQSHRQQ